jgi:hypothetical protein
MGIIHTKKILTNPDELLSSKLVGSGGMNSLQSNFFEKIKHYEKNLYPASICSTA